jgi:hypothetical protein
MKNTNQPQRTRISTITVTLLLALTLFINNGVVISRAETPADPANPGATAPGTVDITAITNADLVCKYKLRTYTANEMIAFRNFIDQNFQNKSSTNSLMDAAFAKYEELRKKLRAKINEYNPQGSMTTIGSASNECLNEMDAALQEASNMIIRKAKTTSAVKQTTALMDKYKDINNQLALLNQTMSNFKSYLDKMAKKVPCYIKSKCNIK